MGHRAKRWSCCDQRSKGEAGKGSGCRRKFHQAPSSEPRYGDVAKKLTDKYEAASASLDASLANIASDDVVHATALEHQAQFDAVAQYLEGERAHVSKFKSLGCDKYIPQEAIIEVIREEQQVRRRRRRADEIISAAVEVSTHDCSIELQ